MRINYCIVWIPFCCVLFCVIFSGGWRTVSYTAKRFTSMSYTVRHSFVGLNSIGILTGGGIGRVMAHWIVNGKPDVDVCGFNVDRLHRYQSNPAYRGARVAESLGNVYKCHYPYKVPQTARGAKRTAVFDRVSQQGAYFRAVSGFETADFYETEPVAGPVQSGEPHSGGAVNAGRSAAHLEYTWGRPSFWRNWEREHRACREGVCLIDMSFMSKFLVQGRDAGACLNRYENYRVFTTCAW